MQVVLFLSVVIAKMRVKSDSTCLRLLFSFLVGFACELLERCITKLKRGYFSKADGEIAKGYLQPLCRKVAMCGLPLLCQSAVIQRADVVVVTVFSSAPIQLSA